MSTVKRIAKNTFVWFSGVDPLYTYFIDLTGELRASGGI